MNNYEFGNEIEKFKRIKTMFNFFDTLYNSASFTSTKTRTK